MIWPVAALAVFLLGFVVVYGSRLQARLGKPVRIFYHPLGPDGRGASAPEEIGP